MSSISRTISATSRAGPSKIRASLTHYTHTRITLLLLWRHTVLSATSRLHRRTIVPTTSRFVRDRRTWRRFLPPTRLLVSARKKTKQKKVRHNCRRRPRGDTTDTSLMFPSLTLRPSYIVVLITPVCLSTMYVHMSRRRRGWLCVGRRSVVCCLHPSIYNLHTTYFLFARPPARPHARTGNVCVAFEKRQSIYGVLYSF